MWKEKLRVFPSRTQSKPCQTCEFSKDLTLFSFFLYFFIHITIQTITRNFQMFQAWKSWKEGRTLELIDTCLKDSCILSKLKRCLHISFFCLQQHHEDLPNMSFVVMMLHSESSLLEPKKPGFYVGKKSPSSSKNQSSSTNEITFTLLDGRQSSVISIWLYYIFCD